jgi:VanZ family protein
MFPGMSKLRAFLPAGVYYLFITVLSAQSVAPLPVYFPGIDKCIHFILYAGFGVCLTWGFLRLTTLRDRPRLGFVLALGALASGLDELHQMFVPGRTAEWTDLLADMLGLLAGWGIVRTVLRLREARRRRREAPDAAAQP